MLSAAQKIQCLCVHLVLYLSLLLPFEFDSEGNTWYQSERSCGHVAQIRERHAAPVTNSSARAASTALAQPRQE